MLNEYDIVIVGAGFTGLCLAHLLDDLPLKILLLEKNSLNTMFSSNLDNRGIALTKSSYKLLQQLKLPNELFTEDSKINKIHISARGRFGATILQEEDLGYVVDSAKLGRSLIKPYTNVQIVEHIEIQDLKYLLDDKVWSFKIKQENYTCKLLVGADGINSIVRQTLQIANQQVLFDHGALVCNIDIATDHNNLAYQRFIDHRILAFLPFGKKRLKCIMTFKNYWRSRLELDDEQYINLLQDLIGKRFKILGISPRLYYPVTQVHAEKIIAPNSVLIGNAANTLSPVAAQGLNLGLRDVAILSQMLHLYGLSDLPTLLAEYARLRIDDHKKTSNFTKNIHKYMAQNNNRLPSMLLAALEFQPWLKRTLIMQNG